MLETSSGDFHGAGDFFGGIFTVLETSLEGFSWCWRLFLEIFLVLETFSGDFHGAGDFFRDFNGA